MTPRIISARVRDVRFPTSDALDGSDAMHPDPDYSAAHLVLTTDVAGLVGHGMTFTIGRGNELCVAAIRSLLPKILGRCLSEITEDMAAFWRDVTSDSQLRWVGPEKGVIHLATAAVVNAVWDLWAKSKKLPLWKMVVDLPARDLVRCIDFRYLSDALTPDEAIEILDSNEAGREAREHEMVTRGFPAYVTSAGWLGYDDDKIRRLCHEGVAAGWNHFKIKVGRDLEDDVRRCRVVREEIGPTRHLMVDANQRWDVPQAIAWMEHLKPFAPWWIEEPTSPDDILGHAAIARAVAPIGVATGEQCQNRVVFKQMMQMNAIRFVQLDSCRLGGVNECLAVMLLAKKFGLPVCPHAGGVGLCEYVAHLIMIDYIRIGASTKDRVAEWVDHLHEHFEDPAKARDGRYLAPTHPGYATFKQASLEQYTWPDGPVWSARLPTRSAK